MSTMTYAEALCNGLDQAMQKDDSVFAFGIGADDHKTIFGSTAGLLEKYGPERIFDTPLSEGAMTGVAIGAALAGMKPVHIHIRCDFLYLALDQIFNIAAKWRGMFGNKAHVPIVVRAVIGRSWGQGAQHSQSPQSLFMQIPGIKVVMPTSAHDAKGLLTASIFDPNPVVIIEHRLLYYIKGDVPDEYYETPLKKSVIRREGSDLTLVANSYMVVEALQAAEFLAGHGIQVEIVDPITLVPLDEEPILNSVAKTGRLLLVDTSWVTCGVSAEIAAVVAEKGFDSLKQPIKRMGMAPTVCPVSQPLEKIFYPNARTIAENVFEMLGQTFPDDKVPMLTSQFKGPF